MVSLQTPLGSVVDIGRNFGMYRKAYTNTTNTTASIFPLLDVYLYAKGFKKIHLLVQIVLKRKFCNLNDRGKQQYNIHFKIVFLV